MTRTSSAAGMVAVLALGIWAALGGSMTAQSDAQSAAQGEGANVVFGPEPQTLFQFVGGPLKRVWADINDAPTQIGETAGFNTLPGADVSAGVPVGDNDLFIVTFSGECRLFSAGVDDWVQFEATRALVVGGVTGAAVPLEPQSPTGSHSMALCGTNSWNMNSAQFAVRLGAGTHRFRARWRIVDSGVNNALRAWLDDWTFKVEQYQ